MLQEEILKIQILTPKNRHLNFKHVTELTTSSHHFLLELHTVHFDILNNPYLIEKILLESLQGSGATYVNHFFHKFSPQGVSGAIIIAESHISIHTWPEHGYAALDVFTCGEKIMGDKIVDNILNLFGECKHHLKYIERGNYI